eukprot:4520094-Pleurochrysis_carterae.AAC.1
MQQRVSKQVSIYNYSISLPLPRKYSECNKQLHQMIWGSTRSARAPLNATLMSDSRVTPMTRTSLACLQTLPART